MDSRLELTTRQRHLRFLPLLLDYQFLVGTIMVTTVLLHLSQVVHAGYDQEHGFLDGRVHHVANFIGDIASLPCEVDLNACGRIYFITFSKNVSNDWQRVYLYYESYQMPLGEYAFGGGRVSLDASAMNSTGLAYMKIHSLTVKDEGTFKCDVTYVHGKCPSLTFTKLYTLVTPKKPIIRVNNREIETSTEVSQGESSNSVTENEETGPVNQIGTFAEGSPVELECSTSGGRPMPDVKWWNGSRPLRSKISVSKQKEEQMVTATIRFIISRYDLRTHFECRVWNNATLEPIRTRIALDIHVKPLSLRVRGPTTPVVAGEMVSLSCIVEGARPPAAIVWFNRSEAVDTHPPSSIDLINDGTFRTSSTLVFIASRYDHNGDFFCKGTNQVLKNRNSAPLLQAITLKVLYPPAVIMNPEGRLPVNETSNVTLNCVFDANPPNVTDVIWYKDGKRLPAESIIENNKRTASLKIHNVTRRQSGFYGCHMKNSFGPGNSSSDTYLDVLYPATVIIEIHPSIVVETSENLVTLRCIVTDGNPRNLIWVHWFKDEVEMKAETEGPSSGSQLILFNVTRSEAGNYSCQGLNGAEKPSGKSSSKQLIVQYPGGPASLSAEERPLQSPIKGSSLTLKCTVNDVGNPPVDTFLWFLNGNKVKESSEDTFDIDPVSVISQGNYSCAAVNRVGPGPLGFHSFRAKAPPRIIHGLPPVVGSLGNQSISFVCRIECQPLCQIEWFRNNETLGFGSGRSKEREDLEEGAKQASEPSLVLDIQTIENKEDPENNLFESLTSRLYLENDRFLKENDIFTCKSQSNGVGPPVSSSTVYQRQYPPSSVQLSVVELEVIEGETFSDRLVRCTSSAKPEPTYEWRGPDGFTGEGPFLSFNSSLVHVSRKMAGNYTCRVTNRFGSSTGAMSFVVLYAPECHLQKETMDNGSVALNCKAESNPPVSGFTWLKNNKTLSERKEKVVLHEKMENWRAESVVVITGVAGDLDSVACVAQNKIGKSKPCKLEIQRISTPAGWVQLLLKDENLIIVAASAAALFIIGSTLAFVVICSLRRKLTGLNENCSFPHYSSGTVLDHKIVSLGNKIPILEEKSMAERRSFAKNDCDIDDITGSLTQKSPLIRGPRNCVPLRSTSGHFDYFTQVHHRDPEERLSPSTPSMEHLYEQTHYVPHSTRSVPLVPPLPKRDHRHHSRTYSPPAVFNYTFHSHMRIT